MAGAEARVGTALINYAAKDAGFSRATKRVNRQLTGFERQAGRAKAAAVGLSASIGGMAKGFLGVAAAIGGARWLENFVDQNAKLASNILQTSRLIGLSTDELQIIRKAMGEFDISTETTTKALKKFTKSVSDARRGLSTQKEAFEALGISMDDLNNLSTWDLLDRVSKGMREVEDTTQKSGAAMDLFGQRAVAVADGLGQVNLKSKEYIDSIRDTGIASAQDLKALQDYIKGTDTLADTMETHGIQAAAKFAKGMLGIKESYTDLKVAFAGSFIPDFVRETLLLTADILDRLDGHHTKSRSKIGIDADVSDFENAIQGFTQDAQREQNLVAELIENRARLEKKLVGVDPDSNLFGRIHLALGEINDDISDANARYENALYDRARMEENYRKFREQHGLSVGALTAFTGPDSPNDLVGKLKVRSAPSANSKDKVIQDIGVFGGMTGPQMAVKVREGLALSRIEVEKFIRAGRVGRLDLGIGATNAEDAARARRERQLRESLTAPLNEFGGVGESVMTPEMERIRKKYEAESALIEGAIIKMSDTTRDRLTPVITGLDSQLNNFFTSIIDGTASAGDAFKNLASQIAQAVFQALVLQPLINSITGGVGSFFGINVPARASGGPVAARSPYIVGEKGPELFVPNMAGNIIPNHRMGGGGVTINQSVEFKLFDDTGFEQRMIPIAAAIKEETMKGTMEALQAPGAQSI